MIKNGTKGSSTTTGRKFEKEHKFEDFFNKQGFRVVEENKNHFYIFKDETLVGVLLRQGAIYKYFLSLKSDYKPDKIVSKKLFPDTAFINLDNKTLYIVEMKEQNCEGSVDEKLQTCDFKKKQWIKLAKPFNWTVEYIYLLSPWFKNEKYKDTLEYILSVNCKYSFNNLELKILGLEKYEKEGQK